MNTLVIRCSRLFVLSLVGACLAFPSTILTIYPSIGPAPSSAFQLQYQNNAELALEHFQSSAGGSGPEHYSQVTGSIPSSADLTTTFPSWMGQVPPPSGFDNEMGNALYFGISIISDAVFTLADVKFDIPELGVSTDLSGTFFSSHQVGINTGTGTRFDGIANSGNDTTLINQLYTTGIFLTSGPYTTLSDFIEALNENTGSIVPAYALGGSSASTTLDVVAAPEPSTWAAVGLGVIGLFALRRKLTSIN